MDVKDYGFICKRLQFSCCNCIYCTAADRHNKRIQYKQKKKKKMLGYLSSFDLRVKTSHTKRKSKLSFGEKIRRKKNLFHHIVTIQQNVCVLSTVFFYLRI